MDCAQIEPRLSEALEDPIVLMMMKADHVDRDSLLADLGLYGPGLVRMEAHRPAHVQSFASACC